MNWMQKTQLGIRIEFLGIGLWHIPTEKRISIFWDKRSLLGKMFPKVFWTQWNNTSIAQRSYAYKRTTINS